MTRRESAAILTARAERAHVTRRLLAGTITPSTAAAQRAHVTRRELAAQHLATAQRHVIRSLAC